MVVAIAICLLLIGVIWWIIVRSYELYVRRSSHPLPWFVYLPAIAFLFVPVCLAVAAWLLLIAGPLIAMPQRYRESPVGIGVWLLYPALLCWAGLCLTRLRVHEVIFATIAVLLLSSRGIWEPQGSRI